MNPISHHCVADETLSAYIDGDLAPHDADAIRDHLSTCAVCREAREELTAIHAELSTSASDIAAPDLWNDIAKNVVPPVSKHRRAVWLPLGLSVAVAAAAVLVIIRFGTPRPEETDSSPQPDTLSAVREVQRAEDAYRQAIGTLEHAMAGEQSSFDPKTMAIVTESLEEVEAAIERSRTAMQRDPGNVEAIRTLLAAYQQKVDLLTDMLEQQI